MAKWTFTFEDVIHDGGPAVGLTPKGEGEYVEDGAWTGATLCAMFLHWAWEKGYFQRCVLKSEAAVIQHHLDASLSSEQSPPG